MSRLVTRTEYEDCIILRQNDIGMRDKTIFFGPLSTSLSDLFYDGFALEVVVVRRDLRRGLKRKSKLRLRHGRERYMIGRFLSRDLLESDDLTGFVREMKNLLQVPDLPVPDDDPLDLLLQKYPKKIQGIMIGNQTLKEFLQHIV